jgi:hypothetical protein
VHEQDAVIHDRVAGTFEHVSPPGPGIERNLSDPHTIVEPCGVSDSGRYVMFTSNASDLVAEEPRSEFHVYLHDRELGTTTRESVRTDGSQPNRASWCHEAGRTMSADGSVLLLAAHGSLQRGDLNGKVDAYVREIATLSG